MSDRIAKIQQSLMATLPATPTAPGNPSRRALMKAAGASLLMMVSPTALASASSLLAVRVWPANGTSRITLESASALRWSHELAYNPNRLVIDLHGVALDGVLQSIGSKVLASDPLIRGIRAAHNRPGVVRVVVDLKDEIDPQLFTLKPVANYGHRLVVDLTPARGSDPLLALLEKPSPSDAARGYAPPPTQTARATPQPRTQSRAARSTVAARNGLFTVVLDAGHGGEDPGAIGARGTYEKHVTLAIVRRLQKKIDAEPNMRAVLTRNGDYFIPLQRRVALARQARGDLFVSVHADAFTKPEANGSSVFVLSERGASSSTARFLAARENESDLVGGVNISQQDGHLARTLLDLSMTATINDSLKLGDHVLREIGGINRLHKPKVEQAGFAVLRAPDIPSVLVETAFISNPGEEARLNDAKYQDKMAEAIMRGIRRYFRSQPRRGTTVAQLD